MPKTTKPHAIITWFIIFSYYYYSMETIGIIGGTGFIGSNLATQLISLGYDVIIFTRTENKASTNKHITYAYYNTEKGICDINALRRIDGAVHLAGEGISDKKWTQQRKKEIINSRIKGTDFIVKQLRAHGKFCKTFISASSISYYGPDTPEKAVFTEEGPFYPDFLGDMCQQWEEQSFKSISFMRTTILRIGIVLGKDGGALPQFGQHMDFGIMPVLGFGNQVISWIEVSDLCRLIAFCLQNEQIAGIYNAVSPTPVTHKQLMKVIAATKGGVKTPSPAPAFLLKILLGELSVEVLKSCTVSAQKIMDAGFTFNYPEIEVAIKKHIS
jgi:hypothetical protein